MKERDSGKNVHTHTDRSKTTNLQLCDQTHENNSTINERLIVHISTIVNRYLLYSVLFHQTKNTCPFFHFSFFL